MEDTMGWGYGWGFHPHMWFGGIMMALFWIAVIIAVVYIVRSFNRTSADRRQIAGDAPLDILKKRYARGEITKEEFDRMKEDLKE
jgi:putative membrane protein